MICLGRGGSDLSELVSMMKSDAGEASKVL